MSAPPEPPERGQAEQRVHRPAEHERSGNTPPGGAASQRWTLRRAGIVNVYQYGNEVLDFADGRLLLRGVNGSGKSTAMNMLLPFLLTTRQRDIDAAREQSGLLASWMLTGREDPNPVGYLWIEFGRSDENFACGCGIRARLASSSVTTWWFATSSRPGIDFSLVDRVGDSEVPCSADQLRERLRGDPVYSERDRPLYRQHIERELFGGQPIGDYIRLIDKVRSPRIGDRIDVELPGDLVDALPQISEQALAEAAAPLDDLEEHRAGISALERTTDALGGLLERYRSYCADDLAVRVSGARQRISDARSSSRQLAAADRARDGAHAEVRQMEQRIADIEVRIGQLRSTISALEESAAFQAGRQLDPLRDHVAELDRHTQQARERLAQSGARLTQAAAVANAAAQQADSDRARLSECHGLAADLARACRLSWRSGDPPHMTHRTLNSSESDHDAGDAKHTEGGTDGDELSHSNEGLSSISAPGEFESAATQRHLDSAIAAALDRRADIGELRSALEHVSLTGQEFVAAQAAASRAESTAQEASNRLSGQLRQLDEARSDWSQHISAWATQAVTLYSMAHPTASATEKLAAREAADPSIAAAVAAAGHEHQTDHLATYSAHGLADLRDQLLAEIDLSVGSAHAAAAAAQSVLDAGRASERELTALLEELMDRSEPDPPRLAWQSPAKMCLADLIDFARGLDGVEQAGIEAALEASGLLQATPVNDTELRLASGELVTVPAGRAAQPLSMKVRVSVPPRLADQADEQLVRRLLDSISTDAANDTEAAMTVGADGSFSIGSLRGRHSKAQATHIGAEARRAALEADRAEAKRQLDAAQAAVDQAKGDLAAQQATLHDLTQHRASLPDTAAVERAASAAEISQEHFDAADAAREQARENANAAERAVTTAQDALHELAAQRDLPTGRLEINDIAGNLTDFDRRLIECQAALQALERTVAEWQRAVLRWQEADASRVLCVGELTTATAKRDEQQTRLDTLERTVGADYQRLRDERDRHRTDLQANEGELAKARDRRDAAVEARATADAEVIRAQQMAAEADARCESLRTELGDALATPGYLAALFDGDAENPVRTDERGLAGLSAVVTAISESEHLISALTADGAGSAHAEPAERADGADGVRQSLRQRRESLRDGWDAEDFRPDARLPLRVEVTGPWGRSTLAAGHRRAAAELARLRGLLTQKQHDALRELLQGLIAQEIAQKASRAKRLVEIMNQRLRSVATSHRVGVRLRWRRSPDLDDATARLVSLLAKQPDLRMPDEDDEVRDALDRRLTEARTEQPDASYRELIAGTLDYRQWHEMAVMVTRAEAPEARLSRQTPLSEGEKKLVTYLPLFVAVAASCDAMAEAVPVSGDGAAGIARFVLLDDAFAKVSADNHEALFGLLVSLDLDFIATSERLWGDHASVPELSIIEIVRDAGLRTILLDRYHWRGHSPEPVEAAP